MLTNHAKKKNLPVFMEQPRFEIDICYLVDLRQHVLHFWLNVLLHNKLGLEHNWDSDSPFSNDILMLTNHAKKKNLPVFMEQPRFEIDIWHLVNLSMCYTGD